jgi:sec-independent protein translocase protein TatA
MLLPPAPSFPLAGLFGLGGPELLLILAVLLLLFGGSKLPALAKGLGGAVREFKKAQREEDPPPPSPVPPPPSH